MKLFDRVLNPLARAKSITLAILFPHLNQCIQLWVKQSRC